MLRPRAYMGVPGGSMGVVGSAGGTIIYGAVAMRRFCSMDDGMPGICTRVLLISSSIRAHDLCQASCMTMLTTDQG